MKTLADYPAIRNAVMKQTFVPDADLRALGEDVDQAGKDGFITFHADRKSWSISISSAWAERKDHRL